MTLEKTQCHATTILGKRCLKMSQFGDFCPLHWDWEGVGTQSRRNKERIERRERWKR